MITPKTARPPKEFTQAVRDLVAERSQLRCEGCGGPGPLQLHHRLYKSRGGRGNAANAIALCGFGNNQKPEYCHGKAHTKAGEGPGWSIRSGGDPALIAVDHPIHGHVLLDDNGGVTPALRKKGG